MKKIIALLFVAFVALNANAQTESWKPTQGNLGFTFGFTGLGTLGVNTSIIPTGTLLFRYYVADDIAIRAGLNFSSSSNTQELKDSVPFLTRGYEDAKAVTKTSSWAVNVGIQKSFGDNNKLEPYAGIDLWVGGSSGGNGKIDTTIDVTGTNYKSTYTSTTTPGSTFKFGVAPFVGFNWFIAKQFAIGAEFGWGLEISNTPAGTFTNTNSTTLTINNVATTTSTTGTGNSPSFKSTSIGGHASGMITASVFFNP